MIKIDNNEVKKIQVEIVKEVDKICSENGLRYFLAFGSLLGAIRHKGFIPWDDDIDIWMPIDDYEQFKTILECKSKRYIILNPMNEKCHRIGFPKIVDSYTYIEEEGLPTYKNNGVFCDIFPLVGVGNDEKEGIHILEEIKKNNWRIRGLRHLSLKKDGIKGLIIKLLGEKFFYKRILKLSHKFDYEKSKYINGLYNADVGMFLYKKSDFEGETYVEFEGVLLRAPKGYHNILKTTYGNYMELPPEDQRIGLHRITAYYK